jgi:hypothetical protein
MPLDLNHRYVYRASGILSPQVRQLMTQTIDIVHAGYAFV